MQIARFLLIIGSLLTLSACMTLAKMVGRIGDGDANWIVVDDASRDGATFTFSEVQIDGNGWLVMHPFEDGKPNGDIYVGATYIPNGENRDVEIKVD